jgi:putative nucleotidyltransferase with HDIG domain
MNQVEHRLKRYGEVVQRLSGALRSAVLYSPSHPSVAEHVKALLAAVHHLHEVEPVVLIGFIGGEVIADDTPLIEITAYRTELIQYMQALGINRLLLERGVTIDEVTAFVRAVAQPAPVTAPAPPADADAPATAELDFLKLPHLRAGRIPVDVSSGRWGSREVTVRQVYSGSIESARLIWESARTEGTPDVPVAHDTVEHLAGAVDSSASVMIGLTGMREHDEYTFTHMVNVAILTMAQARTLGVEGQQLRVLGLSALLHDIGKVRTPLEILNKPGDLTGDEYAIMKRHTSDGATILRAARDMPKLPAIVAFEHHLRPDGTGYPGGLRRATLNLGTALCSIADTYDAMRSKRIYSPPSPRERILAVMTANDGTRFDRNLVRRFVSLMGLYPPATLVRLTTGDVAVVVECDGPDPALPTVRVLIDADGTQVRATRTLSLWRDTDAEGRPTVGVEGIVDAAQVGIDPVAVM